MKGSYLWKLMYLCCALAGCLAGYGVFRLAAGGDMTKQYHTKDNTLVRESENSVFFTEEPEETSSAPSTATPEPKPSAAQTPALKPSKEPVTGQAVDTEAPTVGEVPQKKPEAPTPTTAPVKELPLTVTDGMPSIGTQWAEGIPAVVPTPVLMQEEDDRQPETAEVITYPAEIFGQVPVINRSDAYVSYFEFAYDLIELAEPKVEQQGRSMTGMLAEFVIKALFYGVDIEKLDINAPIPRRQAAMALWLAARILGEPGNGTSAKSAQKYVTDLKGCSSAEKKAVAYLYERGILKGYQVAGQQFYPNASLRTEDGTAWLSGIKQCWK